jgi:hypothetical protein
VATEAPEAPEQEMEASGEDDPIIEIEAFVPKRPKIRVYTDPSDPDNPDKSLLVELKLMREFGIAAQHKVKSDGARFKQLWDKPELKSAEAKELKSVLDRLYRTVVVTDEQFTAKIRDAVDDETRQTVVSAFTYAPFEMANRREEKQRQALADQSSEQEDDDDETDPSTTDS